MKKISICIVTHNNENNILSVLNCIYSNPQNFILETFVVDNNSSDKTVALVRHHFPQVKLVLLAQNRGFGFGHNKILGRIDSDFHVILNPDITFDANILDGLSRYLEGSSDVAMVIPQILNTDGSVQALPRRTPQLKYLIGGRLECFGGVFKKWRDEYTYNGKNFDSPVEIDFCSGCFIMVRTKIFKKLGGFDERFIMYFEDADLTRRAQQYGKTVLNPDFCATHVWARTSAKRFKYLCIHVDSMIKYFKKWHKKGGVKHI